MAVEGHAASVFCLFVCFGLLGKKSTPSEVVMLG